MFVQKMILITTWVVLAVWVIGPIVVIALPEKQHDPQRGMAIGLLMIVSIIGIVVSAMYASGLYWDLMLLKRVPTGIAMFLVALVLVNVVRWLIYAAKGR